MIHDKPMTSLSLLVLRAADPERLARFYSAFGLAFRTEKHGEGPLHWSCDLGGSVLEIYPASSRVLPALASAFACVQSMRLFRLAARADACSARPRTVRGGIAPSWKTPRDTRSN